MYSSIVTYTLCVRIRNNSLRNVLLWLIPACLYIIVNLYVLFRVVVNNTMAFDFPERGKLVSIRADTLQYMVYTLYATDNAYINNCYVPAGCVLPDIGMYRYYLRVRLCPKHLLTLKTVTVFVYFTRNDLCLRSCYVTIIN